MIIFPRTLHFEMDTPRVGIIMADKKNLSARGVSHGKLKTA